MPVSLTRGESGAESCMARCRDDIRTGAARTDSSKRPGATLVRRTCQTAPRRRTSPKPEATRAADPAGIPGAGNTDPGTGTAAREWPSLLAGVCWHALSLAAVHLAGEACPAAHRGACIGRGIDTGTDLGRRIEHLALDAQHALDARAGAAAVRAATRRI